MMRVVHEMVHEVTCVAVGVAFVAVGITFVAVGLTLDDGVADGIIPEHNKPPSASNPVTYCPEGHWQSEHADSP